MQPDEEEAATPAGDNAGAQAEGDASLRHATGAGDEGGRPAGGDPSLDRGPDPPRARPDKPALVIRQPHPAKLIGATLGGIVGLLLGIAWNTSAEAAVLEGGRPHIRFASVIVIGFVGVVMGAIIGIGYTPRD